MRLLASLAFALVLSFGHVLGGSGSAKAESHIPHILIPYEVVVEALEDYNGVETDEVDVLDTLVRWAVDHQSSLTHETSYTAYETALALMDVYGDLLVMIAQHADHGMASEAFEEAVRLYTIERNKVVANGKALILLYGRRSA
jgi:pterin-4a-carbinolamine dehydratase